MGVAKICNYWLEAAQDHIADVAHMTQHDRFVKNL
jgi:hypothetical protein